MKPKHDMTLETNPNQILRRAFATYKTTAVMESILAIASRAGGKSGKVDKVSYAFIKFSMASSSRESPVSFSAC